MGNFQISSNSLSALVFVQTNKDLYWVKEYFSIYIFIQNAHCKPKLCNLKYNLDI